MKIRHFVLGADAQLRKLGRHAVHEILTGRVCAKAFDATLDRELAIVTAVCDDDLIPESAYLLRVPLTGGTFTPAGVQLTGGCSGRSPGRTASPPPRPCGTTSRGGRGTSSANSRSPSMCWWPG
jgi:hypothetical protein